jgi:hypothetical protein
MARSSGNSIPNHPIHQSALVMLGMTMSLMLAFAILPPAQAQTYTTIYNFSGELDVQQHQKQEGSSEVVSPLKVRTSQIPRHCRMV